MAYSKLKLFSADWWLKYSGISVSVKAKKSSVGRFTLKHGKIVKTETIERITINYVNVGEALCAWGNVYAGETVPGFGETMVEIGKCLNIVATPENLMELSNSLMAML